MRNRLRSPTPNHYVKGHAVASDNFRIEVHGSDEYKSFASINTKKVAFGKLPKLPFSSICTQLNRKPRSIFPLNMCCTQICKSNICTTCLASRVQRIFDFFKKIKDQTLWWAQYLNLRHIYLIKLLIFGAVFCAFGFKVWKKYYCNMTYKNFIFKNQKRYQKTQNFMLISNSLKKFLKKGTEKKVLSKTSLTNLSKSGKSAYFRHVFANNFFSKIF